MPHDYFPRTDAMVFAHLPRETQRRAIFLDPRFLARAPKSDPIPMQELPASEVRAGAGPINFIFHTAFCCSTLLTRALDIPGVSMGVKEPAVLSAFSGHLSTGRRTPGALTALGMTLDLLSRPLNAGEVQVIKPNNVANHMMPQILHLRPDAKALVLYSSLDAFVRAIARRGLEGRAYARRVFQQFATAIPLEAGFTTEDLFLQTDLQIAAQAWLMQASFIDAVQKRFGRERVRVLNSDSFLADPAGALALLTSFYGLALSAQQIGEIVNGPVFREHAKQPALAFDAEAYRAQYDQAGMTHFEEINAVRAWAKTLAARCNAPLALEETLLT